MDVSIIDHYRKIQNAYQSKSKKETDLYELKKQIAHKFANSIDYEPDCLIKGKKRKLIVVHTKNEIKKSIIAYPGETFNIGEIVKCYGTYWLITDVDANKQVYTIGEMTQCNLLIRWQNKSGKIITRWCVAENSTKYSSGVVEGQIITKPELQYNILLPLDDETKNLRRDQRFLDSVEDIDGNPTAYKLTQRDTISKNYGRDNRILNITLSEDAFNVETDNTELLIANYFSPAPIVQGQAEIIYSGRLELLAGGTYKIFSPTFKDEDGNILPDIIPVWSWHSSIGLENKFEISPIADGKFRIKALSYTPSIGSHVTINLTNSEGLYSTSLVVEVVDIG